MPLFRIESRTKDAEVSDRRGRGTRESATRSSGASTTAWVLGGAMVGVLLIAAVVAYVIGTRSVEPVAAPAVVPTQGVAAIQPLPGTGAVGSSLPSADPTLPMLNADYTRGDVVALVNGQPFSMGQLETAVRIGLALGSLSGDATPAYDAPEMRDFQIQMLRRQIDVILMRQAFAAAGLEDPDLPIEGLVSGFLDRVGASQQDLEQAMAANGVRQEDLEAWFADSQQVNLFVQQQLMQGRDQAERTQVTRDWLDGQWDAGQIFVNFYEPDVAAEDAGAGQVPPAETPQP